MSEEVTYSVSGNGILTVRGGSINTFEQLLISNCDSFFEGYKKYLKDKRDKEPSGLFIKTVHDNGTCYTNFSNRPRSFVFDTVKRWRCDNYYKSVSAVRIKPAKAGAK